MSKTVVRALAVLAVGVALWVYLRYFGDFTSNQSLALTLIACAALAIFLEIRYAREPRYAGKTSMTQGVVERKTTIPILSSQGGDFVPFRVDVYPEWHALLRDFGFVASDDETHHLRKDSVNTPPGEYSLLRDGIAFTVLQRQPDALLPGLTFWDSRKKFLNGCPEFREAINGIRIEGGFPKLYLRASSDPNPLHDVPNSGIDWKNCKPEFVWELGLIVPEKWWRRACDADSTRAQVLTETDTAGPPPPANKLLIVARLPYSEFDIYFRPNVHFHDGLPDMAEFKRRREKLSARGWEWDQDQIPDEDGIIRVRHKYFVVSHMGLDERGSGDW